MSNKISSTKAITLYPELTSSVAHVDSWDDVVCYQQQHADDDPMSIVIAVSKGSVIALENRSSTAMPWRRVFLVKERSFWVMYDHNGWIIDEPQCAGGRVPYANVSEQLNELFRVPKTRLSSRSQRFRSPAPAAEPTGVNGSTHAELNGDYWTPRQPNFGDGGEGCGAAESRSGGAAESCSGEAVEGHGGGGAAAAKEGVTGSVMEQQKEETAKGGLSCGAAEGGLSGRGAAASAPEGVGGDGAADGGISGGAAEGGGDGVGGGTISAGGAAGDDDGAAGAAGAAGGCGGAVGVAEGGSSEEEAAEGSSGEEEEAAKGSGGEEEEAEGGEDEEAAEDGEGCKEAAEGGSKEEATKGGSGEAAEAVEGAESASGEGAEDQGEAAKGGGRAAEGGSGAAAKCISGSRADGSPAAEGGVEAAVECSGSRAAEGGGRCRGSKMLESKDSHEVKAAMEKLGYQHCEALGEGDCFILSVLAGFEITKEEAACPTPATIEKVQQVREDAVEMIVSNEPIDGIPAADVRKMEYLPIDSLAGNKLPSPHVFIIHAQLSSGALYCMLLSIHNATNSAVSDIVWLAFRP